MTPNSNIDYLDVEEIIINQKALGKRLLWLLTLPILVAVILAVMFYRLTWRITDVEIVAKQLTIEYNLIDDKNFASAVSQYEGIARSHESATVLARLGLLYYRLDPGANQAVALQKLDRARQLDPTYWVIYMNLTYIYASTGQIMKALESGQKALELNKYDAKTYNNLAWLYATSSDPSAANLKLAEQYAERARELTGGAQSEVLDTLAEVYFRKGGEGDRDRALTLLRKAIVLAPNADVSLYQKRLKALFPNEKL
jgi:Tfp pilus assembly protein PilF